MNKYQKRFQEFQNFLDNEPPHVRKAALEIVKILDRLPTKKARANVLRKAAEKLLNTPESLNPNT